MAIKIGTCSKCGYNNEGSILATCGLEDCGLKEKDPMICTTCSAMMLQGPPMTPGSSGSFRCPNLDLDWHKDLNLHKDAVARNVNTEDRPYRKCSLCGVLVTRREHTVGSSVVCVDGSKNHFWEKIKDSTAPVTDPINPSHYQGDYVMRIIEDFNLDFLDGQVIKYLLRSGNKPSTTPLEDHLKAKWYLDRKISNLKIK